jgi:hypothetical protein
MNKNQFMFIVFGSQNHGIKKLTTELNLSQLILLTLAFRNASIKPLTKHKGYAPQNTHDKP